MAGETVITVVGNLVDDPELRFTPSGAAVAKFRVASTPRTFDRQTNEWKDGESLFLTCSVWRQAAENVAESLQRGMRVVVQGRLKQRSYEDREGVKRTVYELDVEEVGASLKNATAKVTKTTGRGGQGGYSGGGAGGGGGQQGGGWGGGSGGGQQQGGGGAPADDPWATSAPASGGNPAGSSGGGGGWGGNSGGSSGSGGSGGSGGGYSDEPPF
ncbi:single-stranded DNA-binding protein [Streptomyces aurantiacus]|uniref:single-stranded DNA-binding protein n=1 Tax=Streptomyces aurantiacus TaxID=47760 RepID=UPI0006E3EE1C|nr:single-stranded DNA-binding protein [Streptomyces aurantiacus]